MTTETRPLTGWRPSPLMVRILSAFVILAIVIGAIYAGTYGAYALVALLGGLALWEFRGLSDGMGSRAPSWLLFPLGAFFIYSGTVLKQVDVDLVLSLALVGGLAAFLFVPGRRQGLGRWAMGMAGALYIGMPFNYYLVLYASQPHGMVWALFIIFAIVACDAAALLVGSRIGRHPFFPAISPQQDRRGRDRRRGRIRDRDGDRGLWRHRPAPDPRDRRSASWSASARSSATWSSRR